MSLTFITDLNQKAENLTLEFRQLVSMRTPDPYDRDFYRYRFENPFFGFVEVENDSCASFYMFTNNDDLVAQHYFWYGRNGYERASVREWIMRAKKASVVYDVGAHTGLFTLLACRSNPDLTKAIAFEPTARAHSRILENLISNALVDKVDVEQLAISDKLETVSLMHYEDHYQIGTGASFLGTEKPFDVTRRETCETTTIDRHVELTGLFPELMKIDVEGAESYALRGARNVISERRTTFLIEVLPSTVDEVIDLLPGYHIYIIDDEGNGLRTYDREKIVHYTNLLVTPDAH